MSSPPNILDDFRTYSYHHILVACDGTDTAEELHEISELTLFDHERAAKKYHTQKTPSGKGSYVVLINGTSDSQLSIKSATWENRLIPKLNDANEGYSTLALDGTLTIKESVGVHFLNLLTQTCTNLGTDPNGVVFLLKTVFVGHHTDGSIEYISNIKPLLFVAYDVGALFDTTGSEYELYFAGVTNGAAKLPHVNSVINGFSYNIKRGETLEQAIEVRLPQFINTHYAKFKDKLVCESKSAGVDVNWDDFQDVVYSFKIDDAYKAYKAGDNEIISKANKVEDPIEVSIHKGSVTIESMLETIMISSKQVVQEKQSKHEKYPGQRFIHKITSTLITNPNKFEVQFQVQRYEVRVSVSEEEQSPHSFKPKPNEGIEFDYIFTGGNIDVKTFDMKMELGMAFFQTLAVANSIPSSSEVSTHSIPTTVACGVGGLTKADATGAKRPKKPLFLGMTSKNPSFRNKQYPGATARYNSLLSRHAAYENIEAKLVIRGNPQLLEETTMMPNDLDPTRKHPASVLRTDTSVGVNNIAPNLMKTPGYVKVNVRMPAVDSDFGDYSEPFWYQGWFHMYAVVNNFNGGEFTQDITMFSIPTEIGDQSSLGESDKDCASGNKKSSTRGDTIGTGKVAKSSIPAEKLDVRTHISNRSTAAKVRVI